MASATDMVLHELSLSLAVLSLEVHQDQKIFVDAQEDFPVRDLLFFPPSKRSAKGGSTQGPKSKRKYNSQTDDLEKAQQIPAGIKLLKEITEDIIWDGLAPLLF